VTILLSNSSGVPIYDQIKEQLRAHILSGELKEGDMLPSLRALARDLRISVLTTTRAYSELEQEGYITSQPGRGFYVMPRNSQLMREQLLRAVEEALGQAIRAAHAAQLTREELIEMLKVMMEVDSHDQQP
jgi:GntR family transcriptional regulator